MKNYIVALFVYTIGVLSWGCEKNIPITYEGKPLSNKTCVEIRGFSVTQQLYPHVEDILGDDITQLNWASNGGIEFWGNENHALNNPITSPCIENSANPDIVIYQVSGMKGANVGYWEQGLEDATRVIERQYPTIERIILWPNPGGPNGNICQSIVEGEPIRASWQNPYIVEAIKKIVDANSSSMAMGMIQHVKNCGEYVNTALDHAGHLIDQAAKNMGEAAGDYYSKTLEIISTNK